MAKIDPKRYGPNTNAVRAGQVRSAEGEHSEPIVATSSFVFKDAAQAAGVVRAGAEVHPGRHVGQRPGLLVLKEGREQLAVPLTRWHDGPACARKSGARPSARTGRRPHNRGRRQGGARTGSTGSAPRR